MRRAISWSSAMLLAGALLVGCAAESHENDPRPPVVPVMSVSVSNDGIEVAPRGIGLPGQLTANLNQNARAPISQADRQAPAVVNFRVSNLTRRNAPLILEGPVERTQPMVASSPLQFTAGLTPGIYRLSSPASRGTVRFVVGRSRISSAGDVLTP